MGCMRVTNVMHKVLRFFASLLDEWRHPPEDDLVELDFEKWP
jgi:hypothetical protein